MNMMLVSVSERVREIGIRKAIGASPYDIGAQFICEAVLLSTAGGAIGVGSGIGMAVGASTLIHHFNSSWISVISVPAVSIALVVSISVGVLFGFFPARRAGRLDAILAIRS
jgi:putative ABC transport system permease protein